MLELIKDTNVTERMKKNSNYYYFMSLLERFREIPSKRKRNIIRRHIENAFSDVEEESS